MQIKVNSLSVSGNRELRDSRARLRSVNFELRENQILCVIGANGAGKSTLLKCLAGDIQPDGGEVLLDGKNVLELGDIERARCIAVMPQTSILNFPFTVKDVVALGRIPHASGTEIDNAIVAEVLAAFDLTALSLRRYPQLSGGEKQRVQLARVFTQVWREEDSRQRLLILDEPLAALDIAHKRDFINLIRKMARQGCAVVLVVHDFSDVASYSDLIMVLKMGESLSFGDAKSVLRPEIVKQAFGIEVSLIQHPQTKLPHVVIN